MFSDTTYQGHQRSLLYRRRRLSPAGKKKLFWFVRRALNIVIRYCPAGVWLICPDSPSGWSWHLTATFGAGAGCQGFFGPFPSAFLDKRCCKNWRKYRTQSSIFPNSAPDFCPALPGARPGTYVNNLITESGYWIENKLLEYKLTGKSVKALCFIWKSCCGMRSAYWR